MHRGRQIWQCAGDRGVGVCGAITESHEEPSNNAVCAQSTIAKRDPALDNRDCNRGGVHDLCGGCAGEWLRVTVAKRTKKEGRKKSVSHNNINNNTEFASAIGLAGLASLHVRVCEAVKGTLLVLRDGVLQQ